MSKRCWDGDEHGDFEDGSDQTQIRTSKRTKTPWFESDNERKMKRQGISSYASDSQQSKKKKTNVLVTTLPAVDQTDTDSQPLSTDSPVVTDNDQIPIFKDQAYVKYKIESSGKRARVWKNLKQIMAAERLASQSDPQMVTYSSLDAPPSFKPAKKYSDITGIEASYVDPQTKLRYANTGEYSRLRVLPSDIISGLLSLRKALPQVP